MVKGKKVKSPSEDGLNIEFPKDGHNGELWNSNRYLLIAAGFSFVFDPAILSLAAVIKGTSKQEPSAFSSANAEEICLVNDTISRQPQHNYGLLSALLTWRPSESLGVDDFLGY